MATLTTKFLVEFKFKSKTGQTPELISGMNATNTILATTTIQFFLDSVRVSEFILLPDHRVFLEERLTAVQNVSFVSFSDTISDLNTWTSFVNKFLSLPLFPQSEFTEEIEREDTQLKYKFRLGEDLLLDADWKKEANTIDFGSRVETTISWADFSNYVDALKSLLEKEIPNARQ